MKRGGRAQETNLSKIKGDMMANTAESEDSCVRGRGRPCKEGLVKRQGGVDCGSDGGTPATVDGALPRPSRPPKAKPFCLVVPS